MAVEDILREIEEKSRRERAAIAALRAAQSPGLGGMNLAAIFAADPIPPPPSALANYLEAQQARRLGVQPPPSIVLPGGGAVGAPVTPAPRSIMERPAADRLAGLMSSLPSSAPVPAPAPAEPYRPMTPPVVPTPRAPETVPGLQRSVMERPLAERLTEALPPGLPLPPRETAPTPAQLAAREALLGAGLGQPPQVQRPPAGLPYSPDFRPGGAITAFDPSQETLGSRIRRFLGRAGEATREALQYLGSGVLEALLIPELLSRAGQRAGWRPEDFKLDPEAAETISPTAAGIARGVGEIAPYLAAGPVAGAVEGVVTRALARAGARGAASAASTAAGLARVGERAVSTTRAARIPFGRAALERIAPMVAESPVGKVLARAAGGLVAGAGVRALQEGGRALAGSEAAPQNLQEYLSRVSESGIALALFGASGKAVGEPVGLAVARRLPAVFQPGLRGVLSRAASLVARGAATGATASVVNEAARILRNPKEFDLQESSLNVLASAIQFAALDLAMGAGTVARPMMFRLTWTPGGRPQAEFTTELGNLSRQGFTEVVPGRGVWGRQVGNQREAVFELALNREGRIVPKYRVAPESQPTQAPRGQQAWEAQGPSGPLGRPAQQPAPSAAAEPALPPGAGRPTRMPGVIGTPIPQPGQVQPGQPPIPMPAPRQPIAATTINPEYNTIELRFHRTPAAGIRKQLREAGFFWSSRGRMWVAPYTAENLQKAATIVGGEPAAPEAPAAPVEATGQPAATAPAIAPPAITPPATSTLPPLAPAAPPPESTVAAPTAPVAGQPSVPAAQVEAASPAAQAETVAAPVDQRIWEEGFEQAFYGLTINDELVDNPSYQAGRRAAQEWTREREAAFGRLYEALDRTFGKPDSEQYRGHADMIAKRVHQHALSGTELPKGVYWIRSAAEARKIAERTGHAIAEIDPVNDRDIPISDVLRGRAKGKYVIELPFSFQQARGQKGVAVFEDPALEPMLGPLDVRKIYLPTNWAEDVIFDRLPPRPRPPQALGDEVPLAPPTTEPSSEPKIPIATGRSATAKTERGTSVETQYAIVEAGQLIASHDTSLRQNPNYPQELQPRDRSRAASELQVTQIVGALEPEFLGASPKASEGAPIVGPDLVVESGNGRTIALQRAYETGHANAQKYKEWLVQNADKFGLDPAAIEAAQAPVLVRIRQTDIDRAQFAREANAPAVAAMSATEQALSDADKLTSGVMNLFNPSDDGQIVHPGNREFIRAFMEQVVEPTDRGRYMTADGSISQEGITRVRNAVFAKAYGDTAAIEKLAESPDNNVRNITNAMLQAAGRIVTIKEGMAAGRLHNLDLTQDIAAAMKKLSQLREQGRKVSDYLASARGQAGAQAELFGPDISPLAIDILDVFSQNARSAKAITAILNAYANVVELSGDPRQATFFEKAKPTLEGVWQAAVRKAQEGESSGVQTTIFDPGTGVGSEAPGRGSQTGGTPAQAGGTARPGPATRGGKTPAATGTEEVKTLGAAALAPSRSARDRFASTGLSEPTPPVQPAARQVQRTEVIRTISKLLQVPIHAGRYPFGKARALGVYKTFQRVIRTKNAEDLQVIAHEVGHHLDNLFGLSASGEYDEELYALAEALYGDFVSRVDFREEGVAEFARAYFSDPDRAKRMAPQFYENFEAALKKDETFGPAIKQVQKVFLDYYAQNPVQLAMASISWGTERQPWSLQRALEILAEKSREFYAAWVDEQAPLRVHEETYLRAWQARGWQGVARVFLEHGQVKWGSREVSGPSLKEILAPVTKTKEQAMQFGTYAVARRVLYLARTRGWGDDKLPMKIKTAQSTVAELDSEAFRTAFQQLQGWKESVLQYYAASGMLSQEQFRAMREANEEHVPFRRLALTEGLGGTPRGSGKKMANLGQAETARRMRGGTGTVINPLESIVHNTFSMIHLAERNAVAATLTRWADNTEGIGWLIERVPADQQAIKLSVGEILRTLEAVGVPPEELEAAKADLEVLQRLESLARKLEKTGSLTAAEERELEALQQYETQSELDLSKKVWLFRAHMYPTAKASREGILMVWRNGEPVMYQVKDPLIYRALLMLDAQSSNIFVRVLRPVASLLRATATTTLEFLGRNAARDALAAAVYGRGLPGETLVRGLLDMAKGGALTKEWMASGGAMGAMVSVDRNYAQLALRNIMDHRARGLRRYLTNPLDILRDLSEAIERAPRVGTYEMAKRAGRDVRGRAIESRDVTLDFGRAGSAGRVWNQIAAFFNAGVQDLDKFRRFFFTKETTGQQKARGLIRALLFITLPTILLWQENRDNERYRNLPRWRRDLFWNIPVGDWFVPVPIPHLLGIVFKVLPERVMDWAVEQNPDAWDDLTPTIGAMAVPNFIPTAAALIGELAMNYNLYQGRPIVPRSEERLEPAMQFGPHTSETAKAAGKVLGASPRKIDHAIRGLAGGIGTYATSITDWLLESTGLIDPPPPSETRIPVVSQVQRAFVVDPEKTGSDVVDRFYKTLDKAERLWGSLPRRAGSTLPLGDFSGWGPDERRRFSEELAKLSPEDRVLLQAATYLRRANSQLSAIRKHISVVENHRTMTTEAKDQRIRRLRKQMDTIARTALDNVNKAVERAKSRQ